MARINFAKNFAGEVYATQTWVGQNYATKDDVSNLGNVFELKGYANTEDKTQRPTMDIEGLGKGDVYLVNETIDDIAQTAEYVCVDPDASTFETGFEKLGVATSTNSYATKSYVDGNFVKVDKFISGKGVSATKGTDGNDNTLTVEAKVATNQGTSNPLILVEGENGGLMVQGVGLKGDLGNTFKVAENATTVWAAVSALDAVVNTLQGGGDDQEGIVSRVEKVETLSKKNARNIEKNYNSIVSLDETTDALIVDNGMLKTAIEATNDDVVAVQTTANKLVTDNGTLKTAIEATNDDVEAVKTTTDALIVDNGTLKTAIEATNDDVEAVKTTANNLVADIDTVKASVNGAIEDVKGIVNEFNNAKFTILNSKPVTLIKGEGGKVSYTMAEGQVVFAVLDGNKQVYPDIEYSNNIATLSADYGTTTSSDTWTVYFGKAVTLTDPDVATVGTLTASNATVDATVGDLTASNATVDATVGTLTASNATVDATVGTLTASNATVGIIEAYDAAEKGTTAQS